MSSIFTNFFWHLVRKQGKKMELPYPNAKPKFSNEGEGLENRKEALKFAGGILNQNKKDSK